MRTVEVAISAGAVCDSKNTQISHVLKAIALPRKYAEGTVRISLGVENTEDDAKAKDLWYVPNPKDAAEVEKMRERALPENGMAILLKEYAFAEFAGKVADDERIKYVYLVTDSEKNYRDMARSFAGKDCVQIYRHYLDNFRINKFGKR